MPSTPLPLSPELLGPVYRLSMEQVGSYVTFLQTQWSTGRPVPDDVRSIIFLLRVTPDHWLTDIRPALLPFFEIRLDGWWHQRLEDTRWAAVTTPSMDLIAHARRRDDYAQDILNRFTTTIVPACDPQQDPGTISFVSDGKEVGRITNMAPLDLFGEPVPPATKEDKTQAFEREFAETFWPAYPIKAGKQPALTAFVKARRKTPLDQIMAGLIRYKKSLSEPGAPSVKYAQGWLNDKRWSDELPAAEARPRSYFQTSHRPDEGVSNAPAYGTPEYHALQKKIGA